MAAVASMEIPKEEEVPAIPLECVLCHKKPSFSDVSHLLTHISSKSHLHQKFNMELKAKSEPAAREWLQRYEDWYSINSIETLLSERLAAKSLKKSTRRGRSSQSSAKSRQSTSSVASMKMGFEVGSGFHTPDHLPPVGHWHTTPPSFNASRSTSFDESGYHTPGSNGYRPGYYYHGEAVSSLGLRHPSLVSDMDSYHHGPPPDMDMSVEMLEDINGKGLKGVVWPGMALFDSATPDQKRKRNQRKDGGVVEQMKLTSEAVMATETVWAPNGDVCRVRDIYASPSIDGSPPSTPPRKKKQRPRAETPTRLGPDGMQGGSLLSNVSKRKRAGRPTTVDTVNARQARATKTGRRRKAGPDEDYASDMHGMSMEEHRHRGAFSVYYDGAGASQEESESQLADAMHQENNGFGATQHNRPALQQLDGNMSLTSPSAFFKTEPSRYFDGETEAAQLAYRPHSTYGSGVHNMSNGQMNALGEQRDGGMYSTFDSHLFRNSEGSQVLGVPGVSGVPFHGVPERRLGFGFELETSTASFGFTEQRESALRETAYADQTFRNPSTLFEM